MSDQKIWQAVLEAIQTEKNAMYFYQRAALRMQDPAARKIFEQLAEDEKEHVDAFFEVYQGAEIPDLPDYLSRESGGSSDWMEELSGLLDGGFDDLKALQLAMLKELHLEKHLRQTAQAISDPAVRAVYEVNADSTRQHFLAIEAEYSRLTLDSRSRGG